MDNQEEVLETSGQEISPVEEQPEVEMPTTEQQPIETEGELPTEVSERTKLEFEKLKSHNKELAEKLKQVQTKDYGKNVFEAVYGQPAQRQVPQSVSPTLPNFVDENGYVDTEALKKSLYESNAMSQQAIAEAKKAQEIARQQEERRQIKEAHEKFPWLNPSNQGQFDQTSFELVRDRLVRNMWEGKEQTLAEVAEEVSKFHTPAVQPEGIKEQAVAEYKEKQAIKAQASAVQAGKGQPREERGNLEELRERTLHGDSAALDERLANII
jgi:hypothetical protein